MTKVYNVSLTWLPFGSRGNNKYIMHKKDKVFQENLIDTLIFIRTNSNVF